MATPFRLIKPLPKAILFTAIYATRSRSDKESKLLKFHPNPKAAPDLVNSDKSLDLKA
jgi:hypothetical protein